MSFKKNIAILLFFSFFLQSCGFQPLYNMESLSGFIVNQPNDKSESSVIIYKGLDRALKPISTSENFIINFTVDERFEDIDVRAKYMEDAMGNTTASATPEDQVDALISQVADEHQLDVSFALDDAGQVGATPAQQQADPLADRLEALRR